MKKRIVTFIILFVLFIVPIQAKEVYLGGDSIGIEIHYDGLLITSTYNLNYQNKSYNPINDDIQPGDTIKEIDGKKIETLEDFNQVLNQNKNDSVILTLLRDKKTIYRQLKVIRENNTIKTGLFLRDEIMGIGTLTYIDPETNTFGSLGHEILDQDTKQIVQFENGYLFHSSVNNIMKAQLSRVGEKQALIHFDETIGYIDKINQFGVFGKNIESIKKDLFEIGYQDEINEGKAVMYTVLENELIEPIEITITKKYKQNKPDIKSFEFKIIDSNALEKTNGIVQGMSGSPIIQNGKLIGAVTHVMMNDPKMGYGIYIENMLDIKE